MKKQLFATSVFLCLSIYSQSEIPVSISLDETRAMPTRTINMAFDIYRVRFLGFKTTSL